jgi:hypothetical protein
MIKYRTMFGKIDAVEIVRETEKQVVLTGHAGRTRRENKNSDWLNWHDTWEDAHKFLIAEAEKKVKKLRLDLERANGELGQINGMKEPK